MKLKLLLLSSLLFVTVGWGQVALFSETIGTVGSTTTITAHETANGFDNDAYTMTNGSATNPADIRVTSPSSGSGSANVFFASSSGQYGFAIEGIDASAYTSLTLDYLYRKESASAHATFSVEFWNGSGWVTLANTSATLFNETSGAGTAWYSAKQLSLPVAAQINGLKIRFLKSGTNAIRIDDIVLKGISSCVAPATPSGSISGTTPSCGSTSLSFSGTAVGPTVYYWQTSATGISTSNDASGVLNSTTSGSYYVRAYNGSCWSAGAIGPYMVTVNSPVAISTQPANQTVTSPATASFTVAATGTGLTYQWQVSTDGGTVWNNVSTGTGVTTASYTTAATTAAMSGYLYHVIVSGTAPCISVISNTASLTVNAGPCVDENFNSFTGASFGDWIATGMSNYTSAGSSGASANSAQFNDTGDVLLSPTFTNATELSFWLKGNSTNSTSALLVEGFNGVSWVTIQNITNSLPASGTTKVYNASSTPALPVNLTQFRFTYTKGSGNLAFDDVKVMCSAPVSSCGTPVTQPTALNFSATTFNATNGSYAVAGAPGATGYLVVYSTNNTLSASDLPVNGVTYTAGTTIGDGAVGYVGTSASFSLSGLTGSTAYYVFVFAYNSGSCAIAYNTTSPLSGSVTTAPAYCASSGNTDYNTSVTNVTFNAINNTSAKPSGFSDYTAISTTVQQGNSYTLSAKINTDGNYTVLSFAWIDFNHDLDFNDPGEAFDLGSATNVANGLTSASPLSIAIPLTAVIGATRMRVIATYDGDSSPCLAEFDGEVEDYTINIIAACVPTHSVTAFAPSSGPTSTQVTITGTGFTTGTTVMFNGITASVTFVNSTTLIATVPAGQTTGAITVTEAGCKVITASNFTQIKQTGTCVTGNNLSDLIISETYDSAGGNSWYVELYNPTGSTINLDAAGANYKIIRYGDIGTTSGLRSVDVSGIIPAGGVYVADLGSDSSCDPMSYNYVNKGNGINENDEIRLTKNDITVDVVHCPNEKGYVIRRNAAAVGPSAIYSTTDWTLLTTETCADLGVVPFAFTSNLPTVNTNPSDVSGCGAAASFTVTASSSGVSVLTYQWFYNNGSAAGWTSVSAGSFVGVTASGITSGSLDLNGAIGVLDGYQFYCQVTQGGTCSVASDAAQLNVISTTWNGLVWSNGTPDLTKLAIVNGNYNTAANGDFECCSLLINAAYTLDIKDGDYVSIQNDLTVNGTLEVQNQGSLVMISDSGIVTNNGITNVRKMSTMFDRYDYTFWSSPVAAAPISIFSQWQTNYIFKLNAAAFRDDNDDSHDDNMDAWVFTPQVEVMSPGRGYAVMGKINQTYPAQQGSVYSGAVNNGVVSQPITLSLDNTKVHDDFNLVGNPYPSAISADAFIAANPDISGTLYFWTHEGDIQVAAVNPGPMAMNFSPDDFAYYNLAGGVGTRVGLLSGNGNSNAPVGFIASGQGFQVDADAASSVVFNNSMRNKTYLNTNFYRAALGPTEKDRIWLNLTNPEGIFSQQLIGFFPQATMGVDRGYDGYCVKSATYAAFYSMIDDKPYKIQGRSSFDVNDRIPLGFRSAYQKTYTVSIGDIEGVLRNQNVYIEDLQLNIIHDLKMSPYVFTTAAGEFNSRFVLRFTNATLGNDNFEVDVNSVLVYAEEGINVTSSLERIKDVFVYDVLGRLVAERKEVNNTSVSLQNVRKTQGTLFVKVVLDNGQTTTKKVLY